MTARNNPKPDRRPDEEVSGAGKARAGIQARAEEAYYAELFVDAMGGPVHSPGGWW